MIESYVSYLLRWKEGTNLVLLVKMVLVRVRFLKLLWEKYLHLVVSLFLEIELILVTFHKH